MTTTAALSHGSAYNRSTAYKVAVTINGRLVLAGYTACKTKSALLKTALNNDKLRQLMLDALFDDDESTPRYERAFGWTMSPCIRIHFTGGTLIHPMIAA